MIKTVELLGIRISDNYVREVMGQVMQMEQHPGLHILEEISAEDLLRSEEQPEWKDWYNKIDLVLMGDTVLLDVIGRISPGRRKEIQDHIFLMEYMKYAQRTGKRVYLLAESYDEAARAEGWLKRRFARLKLAGISVLEEGTADQDGVVNEINGELPDTILSMVGMPRAMEFLQKEWERIDAGLWCGLGKDYLRERKNLLRAALKKHLDKNKLARSIGHDQEAEHEEEPR